MLNFKIEEREVTKPVLVRKETFYSCTVEGCNYSTIYKNDAEMHYVKHEIGEIKTLNVNGEEYQFIYFKDEELFNLYRDSAGRNSMLMDRCYSKYEGEGWYSISSYTDSYNDRIGFITPVQQQIIDFNNIIQDYKGAIEFINKLKG